MIDARTHLRRGSGIALALLLLAALPAAAQVQVKSYVQPDSGITDTTPVQFVIELQGARQNPDLVAPTIGKLKNLRLIEGPSTSSRFSWVNGRSTSSIQLIYTLLPEGPGDAEIPSMSLKVDGKPYALAPIRFRVAAAPSGPPAGAPGRPADGRDRGSAADTADVFLRAELGAAEIWVGEPVALNVTLFSRTGVNEPRWRATPTFANFWAETLEVDPDREAYRTRIGDRVYVAHPLERRILVPPGAGEFEIEPYVLQLRLGSDWFDIFGRAQTIIRKSEPLKLRVKQLPAAQPEGFTGAVGRYTLKVDLDRDETPVNDAVALRVKVQGEGSLRSVGPPPWEAPAELKVYGPEVTSDNQPKAGKLVSEKTWEWILVPLAAGQIDLPAMRFPYFDPGEGRFRVAESEPLRLAVRRGEATLDAPVAGVGGGGIRLERRDLLFIKPLGERPLAGARAPLHERGVFLLLLALPLVWTPLIVILGRRRDRLRRDRGLARARRARTRARKRFRAARRLIADEGSAGFHEAVARSLVEYVADRFDRAPAGLTYELAGELLASRGVDETLRRRFRSCLESCDFARFVPASAKSERRSELLEEAAAIVEALERAW